MVASSPRDLGEALEPAAFALSMGGGTPGAAAGIADIELQARKEGREPELWERGLGAAGGVPIAGGLLRKMAPVTTKLSDMVKLYGGMKYGPNDLLNFINLGRRDSDIGILGGLDVLKNRIARTIQSDKVIREFPRIEQHVNSILQKYPEMSAGTENVIVDVPGGSRYMPVSGNIYYNPLEEWDRDYVNKTNRTRVDTMMHELVHGIDSAAGSSYRPYTPLTEFLGTLRDSTKDIGFRMPGEPINNLQTQGWVDDLDIIRQDMPDFGTEAHRKRLLSELERFKRSYSDRDYATTPPTELLSIMMEDPVIADKAIAWRDLFELMRDRIRKGDATVQPPMTANQWLSQIINNPSLPGSYSAQPGKRVLAPEVVDFKKFLGGLPFQRGRLSLNELGDLVNAPNKTGRFEDSIKRAYGEAFQLQEYIAPNVERALDTYSQTSTRGIKKLGAIPLQDIANTRGITSALLDWLGVKNPVLYRVRRDVGGSIRPKRGLSYSSDPRIDQFLPTKGPVYSSGVPTKEILASYITQPNVEWSPKEREFIRLPESTLSPLSKQIDIPFRDAIKGTLHDAMSMPSRAEAQKELDELSVVYNTMKRTAYSSNGMWTGSVPIDEYTKVYRRIMELEDLLFYGDMANPGS